MNDPSPRDAALMRRTRDGDEEAFRVLFERHAAALGRRIRRRLPDRLARRVSVADVLQETRIVAFARCGNFDTARQEVRPWLLGIADRKVCEAVRRHVGTAKRDAGREISRGGRVDTANVPGHDPSPSQIAMASELAERIRRIRATLPEEYGEVLRLVHDEGLTLREAASRIGRSREATKKLYARAFCRFKRAFEADEGERDG